MGKSVMNMRKLFTEMIYLTTRSETFLVATLTLLGHILRNKIQIFLSTCGNELGIYA